MNWESHHRRGETLRRVGTTADARLDGLLPMDVAGVAENFHDELDLLAALVLRWHTRLSGRLDGVLSEQPLDLETAVAAAWRRAADEMPGVRLLIDHYREHPVDEAMASALARSADKERALLAVSAGLSGPGDPRAARAGERLEGLAREGWRPLRAARPARGTQGAGSLVARLKAALVA